MITTSASSSLSNIDSGSVPDENNSSLIQVEHSSTSESEQNCTYVSAQPCQYYYMLPEQQLSTHIPIQQMTNTYQEPIPHQSQAHATYYTAPNNMYAYQFSSHQLQQNRTINSNFHSIYTCPERYNALIAPMGSQHYAQQYFPNPMEHSQQTTYFPPGVPREYTSAESYPVNRCLYPYHGNFYGCYGNNQYPAQQYNPTITTHGYNYPLNEICQQGQELEQPHSFIISQDMHTINTTSMPTTSGNQQIYSNIPATLTNYPTPNVQYISDKYDNHSNSNKMESLYRQQIDEGHFKSADSTEVTIEIKRSIERLQHQVDFLCSKVQSGNLCEHNTYHLGNTKVKISKSTGTDVTNISSNKGASEDATLDFHAESSTCNFMPSIISLLSWEGGIYSDALKSTDINCSNFVSNIIKLNENINIERVDIEKNGIIISHYVKQCLFHLVLKDIYKLEKRYPIILEPNDTLEKLKGKALSNDRLFHELSNICSAIDNTITTTAIDELLKSFPEGRICIFDCDNKFSYIELSKKGENGELVGTEAFDNLINLVKENIISLPDEITRFITSSKTAFIKNGFLGKINNLTLQRKSLESIRRVANEIWENISFDAAIMKFYRIIYRTQQTSIAIMSKIIEGEFSPPEGCTISQYIINIVNSFKQTISNGISLSSVFYDETKKSMVCINQSDLDAHCKTIINYLSSEFTSSYKNILLNKSISNLEMRSSKKKLECARLSLNIAHNGLYCTTINYSDFSDQLLESIAHYELHEIINEHDITKLDLSNFYKNFMETLLATMLPRISVLEEELASFIIKNDLSLEDIKILFLSDKSHFNKFKKFCKDELEHASQYNNIESYLVVKHFNLYKKDGTGIPINMEDGDNRALFSLSSNVKLIKNVISSLPSIVMSTIKNNDTKLIENAFFDYFHKILISKSSLNKFNDIINNAVTEVSINSSLKKAASGTADLINRFVDISDTDKLEQYPVRLMDEFLVSSLEAKTHVRNIVERFRDKIDKAVKYAIILTNGKTSSPSREEIYILNSHLINDTYKACISSYRGSCVEEYKSIAD
ncbi:hypothetical protein [Candidatus Ichthyocystis sparus]|nr:hypothetical protein [Candidatus Ichthyocystis sparus]